VEYARPPDFPSLDRPLNVTGLAERELRRALTELWQTDDLRARALSVEEEAQNVLYFLEQTIVDVVPWLHDDLRTALAEAYPGEAFSIPPFLRFRRAARSRRRSRPLTSAPMSSSPTCTCCSAASATDAPGWSPTRAHWDTW